MPETVVFPKYLIDKVKSAVVKRLDLKDEFSLSDMFDGEFILRRHLNRVAAVYCLQSTLGQRLVDEKEILKCPSLIEYKGGIAHIVAVELNGKIKIPRSSADRYIVVGVFDNFSKSKILGVINKTKCLHLVDPLKNSNNTVRKDLLCVVSVSDLDSFDKEI